MAKKSKTLNPETATVREVAELYATENKLQVGPKAFGNMASKYLGELADEPGSAVKIFMPNEAGETSLSGIFKSLDLESDNPKSAMQALRQVGVRIAQELPANSNILTFLPESKPDTAKNVKIFGIKEPPKAVSEVSIKTDPATMQEFFRQISEFAKDPKQEATAMAIIFNLQNGLRPNAAAQLKVDSYYPETRAIYVPAEAKGAKGRKVNVPLNDIADAILQNRLQDGKTKDGFFFVKPNGKPVESGDMTRLLANIKIPDLVFDSGTNQKFDSLTPEGDDVPGKRGSTLIRNIHTKIAQRSGIAFERIAYLQGRSLKAAAEGSTGEVTGYMQEYPGDLDVDGPDARNANTVSTYFADAAKNAGFDVSAFIAPPSQRIGRATPGFEDYAKVPAQDTVPLPTPAAADVDEPNIEVQNKLTEEGFDSKGMADAMKEYQKTGKMPSSTKGVVGTVVGVVGTVASKGSKAALSALPGVGFESTRRELIERGETPEKAAGQAFVEEASGAMGIIGPASRALTDLTISGTEKALEQQYGIKGDLTDESLEDILTRLISGGRMASGGFIEKGD